jgi:Ca2+-binding EF-hand superfamily protein
MGCIGSRFAAELETLYPRSLSAIGVADRINWFASFFREMDADASGSVSLFDFLERCDIERTPFIERVFAIVDRDASKSLDFREWAFGVWHFATLTKQELVGFLFDLYDTDSSGRVDKEELETALREAYGVKASGKAVSSISKRINKEPGHSLTRGKFVALMQNLSEALHPAVQAQSKLRRAVIGPGYWEAAARKRAKHASDLYLPTSFRKLFTKLVEDDLKVRARRDSPKAGQVAPK